MNNKNIRQPKRRARGKFTSRQVIAALRASGGVNIEAARMLKCSPSTIANYIERDAKVAKAKSNVEEEVMDIAESRLKWMISLDGHPDLQLPAVLYFLRAKGRSRGYGGVHATRIDDLVDFAKLTPPEARIFRTLFKKAKRPRK
jgi:DNA-binding CsgD family transcriptional regulator